MDTIYYFEIEKLPTNTLTFAYIYREGQEAARHAPVQSFHSRLDGSEAIKKVTRQAVGWIEQNGVLAP